MYKKIKSKLFKVAIKGETITYSEILKYMNTSKRKYGIEYLTSKLLDIGNECYEFNNPLINFLVINSTGLPGNGAFVWYGKHIGRFIDINDSFLLKNLAEELQSECYSLYQSKITNSIYENSS